MRIMSSGVDDFLSLSKQFFDFVDKTPILKAVIAELLARNQQARQDLAAAKSRIYGETAEEAATIGYLIWQSYAKQNDVHEFYRSAFRGYGDLDESLGRYRDWYVEPLFEYLDEKLDDANIVLALLIRYKQKVEWYRRDEVLDIYRKDTTRGEWNLKQLMFEFLFDQGLQFQVEPVSASGEPDVVSLEGVQHHLIGEVKIFDPDGSRGKSYIAKAFAQAHKYAHDYNEPVAYLIVFNISKKQLRVELPSSPDGIPRFELNNKTIFFITIDLQGGKASTLGVPDVVTISASELVREVEESVKTGDSKS